MIEFLHMGQECDTLGFPIGVSHSTTEVVDYTLPVFFAKVLILTAGKDDLSRDQTWDLISGNPLVLGSLFAYMIIFACLLYINERLIWKNITWRTTFAYMLWSSFGSLFLEPLRRIPTSISSRILVAVWVTSVMIFLSFVGGNLKANIAVRNRHNIDSVTDLLATPSMKTIMLKGLPYLDLIQISRDEEIAELYRRTEAAGGVITWPDYIFSSALKNALVDEKLAMIVPEVTVDAYPLYSGQCLKNGKGWRTLHQHSKPGGRSGETQ